MGIYCDKGVRVMDELKGVLVEVIKESKELVMFKDAEGNCYVRYWGGCPMDGASRSCDSCMYFQEECRHPFAVLIELEDRYANRRIVIYAAKVEQKG